MIKKRLVFLLVLCTSMMVLAVGHVVAQDEPDEPAACSQIVENAMEQLSSVCAANGIGQVCIGNSDVQATFTEEVDGDFFTQPGDIADLSLIESFTTSPLDIDSETWGLAIFNSTASLPVELVESMDGKGVVYMALGGVEVSDATPADEIVVPLEQGMPLTTLATADLRQAPLEIDGDFNNVVNRIPAETTVSADAITPDQDWVRVIYEDASGWVRSSVLPDSADLSGLVEIGPDDFTQMQSINVAANGNNGSCEGTYQGVIIHGPDAMGVNVVVNGVPVQVDSTIFVIPLPGGRIRIFTFSGVAVLFPTDPARRTIIPPGFFADVDLATGQLVTPNPFEGTNIAPFGGPFLIRFLNFLNNFFPTNLIHYTPEDLGIQEASGITVELFIIYINVQRFNIVQTLCLSGALPENVCRVYGYV